MAKRININEVVKSEISYIDGLAAEAGVDLRGLVEGRLLKAEARKAVANAIAGRIKYMDDFGILSVKNPDDIKIH